MSADLMALIILLAVLAAGGVVLYRRLPRPGHGVSGAQACVACGMPAGRLSPDSFRCPGCGRDVRELGLAPAAGRSIARPFWWAVGWTVAVLILAVVGSAGGAQLLPWVMDFNAQQSIDP